ncbi:MAG TPA: hypothetical protein PK640_00110 [Verrucomicrobiota bacterium]|nr:hypothetical protein [Verrucomicrobiota bacterium]
MSNTPEFELDLDLQLLPAWARQPSTENRYAKYEGDTEGDRRDWRGDRFGRRDAGRSRPPRRDRPPGGPGRGGPAGRHEGRGEGRGERGERGRGPGPEGRPAAPRWQREEPVVPLPDVEVSFTPEEAGVESLARQIKLTGRAYPLFGIAELILKRPDKVHAQLHAKKGADGAVGQPLVVCSLDDSIWLSEDEAVAHILRHHFATFYQIEKVPTDPPKGTYTFVAQCGMSGTIFGPPNYHDYQDKLRKFHAERYARMPFDVYKARVKIVKDEAVVKKWIEEQSAKLEYICLNVPESCRFGSREDVEKHFRATHLPNLIRSVDSYTLRAGAKRPPLSPGLQTLLRHAIEDQKRFPLKVATVLSQQFAGHGLQFFKVNRTVTHVCVARPHYLDLENTVVSDGVRKIVDFINTHPGSTRRKLIQALAPTPPAPATPPPPLTPPVPTPQPAAAETAPEADAQPAAPPAAAAPAPPPPAAPTEPQPTPEQTAVIADLHWLIHQGHVIEFTDGRLETAKAPKPKPTPPPPAAKTAEVEAATPAPADAAAATQAGSPAAEVPTAPAETPAPAGEATAPPLETPANAGETPAAEVEVGQSPEPAPAPTAEAAPPAPAAPAPDPNSRPDQAAPAAPASV